MSEMMKIRIPRRFDDGFRGGVAMLVSALVLPAFWGIAVIWPELLDRTGVLLFAFAAMCASLTTFSAVYLVWTHRVYTSVGAERLLQIAAAQYHRGAGPLARLLGLGSTVNWSLTAAATALVIAIAASVLSSAQTGLWLSFLVLLTAAGSWATMAYAFAVRYLRLHASGERIEFDIVEQPEFIDFVSMAVMVSSVGALSGGTPRTRADLSAVRTHTVIAFTFNALVVAMVVSLMTGFLFTE